MRSQILATVFLTSFILVRAEEKKDDKSEVEQKKDKRGLFDFGYGQGLDSFGSHGFDHKDHTTYDFKEVNIPIPAPYPVHIEKSVPLPYPVKVPVHIEKPVPVPVIKPYPVPVDKYVPYPVEKTIPVPVNVPYKVPYPVKVPIHVEKPYPVPVIKKIPHYISKPYLVEKEIPYFVHDYHKNFDFHH